MRKYLLFIFLLIFVVQLFCRTDVSSPNDKKFDLLNYHNVGNIWLRISNYGFFGSGKIASPQWPSLEYPGGSAIDYLFQGALWFGAKKQRRNMFGEKLFWLPDPVDEYDVIPASDPNWNQNLMAVIDTLVTVGYDGRWNVFELLPAYNPLETSIPGDQYDLYNPVDAIMHSSIRKQRKGVDDDGDGLIDEDPAGYAFPFGTSGELPVEFEAYGSNWLSNFSNFNPIIENLDLWFPLGFVDLSDETNTLYNFTEPQDDDFDRFIDEDGYPVSEQDFISYYYDYSPFGTSGQRDWGTDRTGNIHYPLKIRVRQLSYQWSYKHIENLVYVEFDITNMNSADTLFDCVMGIYMDSDVGPQAWSGADRANDDVSSYIPGEGYQFSYTYDADGDQGLTSGYVGSRVCTPDPEQLEFSCWYWEHGYGPRDGNAISLNPTGITANEKYWLLSGNNPDGSVYESLLDGSISPIADTRYLYGFHGDMLGLTDPTESSWNLSPGKTMKIVIAVFPGNSVQELKNQSVWAKQIYGKAQNLQTVTQPDLFVHYVGPEPPAIPKLYVELAEDGSKVEIYWDNSAEIENQDNFTVTNEQIGWQDVISGIDSYVADADTVGMPDRFKPENWNLGNHNENAIVNPWTGYRLRHDFQGYSLWSRTASGSQEDWKLEDKWDKIDTEQDHDDYVINNGSNYFYDFGGDLVIDEGLPNAGFADESDLNYYHFDEMYRLVQYELGDKIYGKPLYNWEIEYSDSLQNIAGNLSSNDQALMFKHPNVSDSIFLKLYQAKLIPLIGYAGYNYVNNGVESEEHRMNRLSRRYYDYTIHNLPKGFEYYLAVTSWDRGMPEKDLLPIESGRDIDANMKVFIPGPSAKAGMNNIYVVPNPYVGQSLFDGRRDNDIKGDKSRRIWFVNIPIECSIKIFTLTGDLVDTIHHNGEYNEYILTISRASYTAVAPSGIAAWDLLSRNNQIIAPGVYLFSVKNKENGKIKVGKFVIIK